MDIRNDVARSDLGKVHPVEGPEVVAAFRVVYGVGRVERCERRAEPVVVVGAVIVVDVTEALVVTGDAEVVREIPVGRRTANLDHRTMVEDRRADAELPVSGAWERTGADDLVDVSCKALAFGVRGVRAGVDLNFGISERRGRARGIVVERTVDGNAVEFVTDLVEVAAANVDGVVITTLVGDDVGTGNRRDCRVGGVEVSAAAEGRRRMLRRGVDRVDVGGRSGFHQRTGRRGRYATDRFQSLRQAHPYGLHRVGENDLTRHAFGLILALVGGDRVRVGSKCEETEVAGRVGRCRRGLRRTAGRYAGAGDRRPRVAIDDGAGDTAGNAGDRRRALGDEGKEENERGDEAQRSHLLTLQVTEQQSVRGAFPWFKGP